MPLQVIKKCLKHCLFKAVGNDCTTTLILFLDYNYIAKLYSETDCIQCALQPVGRSYIKFTV